MQQIVDKMTVEQAFSLLQQATSQYKGTLRDHQLILEAYKVIMAAVNEPKLSMKADIAEAAKHLTGQ